MRDSLSPHRGHPALSPPLTAAAAGASASLKSTAHGAFALGPVPTGTGDRVLRYEIR